MRKPEHALTFKWERPCNEPLRGVLSWILALTLCTIIVHTLTLPYSEKWQKLKEERHLNLLKSSTDSTLNYLPHTEHFHTRDPFQTSQHILSEAENAGRAEVLKQHKRAAKKRSRYKVRYQEVPYQLQAGVPGPRTLTPLLPRSRVNPPPRPHAPSRPETSLHIQARQLELPDTSHCPLSELGSGLTEVRYRVKIDKTGRVAYALPLTPSYHNKRLTQWIKSLPFPARPTAITETVTITEILAH